MPKSESPLHELAAYLPDNTYDEVIAYLHCYKVHLTVTRERRTLLGDYRNRSPDKNHRISVNGNLNKYAFLITLLHELGHLLAFEKYGHRIQAHGAEWKNEFGNILATFISKKIFPADIEKELMRSLKNPAASTCAEENLLRILRRYDAHKPGFYFVEQLPVNSIFKEKNGRVFMKGNKVRKRFVCKELPGGKLFLFSPVAEVELVTAGR
ncbi:MAG TPA: SprT-like domain-containing protein [Chitinophagaceae bacterium]|nr:SprT-like domain-containing protein [Chitinophagaceae bacterium]